MRPLAIVLVSVLLLATPHAQQLDPHGVIVIDGNSLTQYRGDVWDYPNCSQPCSNAFGDYTRYAFTELSGLTIATVGVPGAITPELTATASVRVDPYFNPAKATNVVVFWEVSNDMIVGNAGVESALEHLKIYIAARHAVGWKVAIVTLIPRYMAGAFDQSVNDYETGRLASNAQQRARWNTDIGADLLIDVAAAEPFMVDQPVFGSMYTPNDRIHLSMNGSRFVGKTVADALTRSGLLK